MNLPELEEIEASVLLSTFLCRKKRFKVFFHKNQLIWDKVKPPFAQTIVPIGNVIAVRHSSKNNAIFYDDEESEINPHAFIVHYVKQTSNNCLKYCNVVFSHNDPVQVQSWVKTLQNYLRRMKRPKRLIIFVNPFGGRKNGINIYQKICKPLFEIAGVDVTLNISQRKNQIRDNILEYNLSKFDGIACVGGDGTVSEVFNGLVLKRCKDLDLDIDDVQLELPKPEIPIGIIPGGSTDTIAYCLHGTTDVVTAVLYIILGPKINMDLVSVHDENKLLRLYASVLSYGYLGDVVYHSNKYRWLGPRRYEYSGFKTILANNGYDGEVAVLSRISGDKPSRKCFASCEECSEFSSGDDSTRSSEEQYWNSITGRFFMLSGANISCSCDRSPNGIAPYCHLGNGKMHLVVVRHTNFWNSLKLLLRLANKRRGIEDFPFVEVHEVSEFCFRPKNATSRWNCDGEVQNETEIRAKVRCQLLTVFARGRPVQQEEERTCSCC